jgi:sugar phosphate isomerase/epimerase
MTSAQLAVAAPELFGTGPLPNDLSAFDAIADLGIDSVELWTPWQITIGNAARVAARLAERGLGIACISSPSYLHGEPTGEGRRLIAAAIEIAQQLGVPRINTYFGHGGDGVDEHAIASYVHLAADLIELARQASVTVVIENEFDSFGHDPEHWDVSRRPESLRRLVDEIADPRVRLNFDAANLRCAGADVAVAAGLLADVVGYVHVKDVVTAGPSAVDPPDGWNSYSDGDRWFHTVELGTGEVPWPTVLDRLAAAGYAGPFTLEPHCRRDRLVEQLGRSVAYLRAAGV